MLTHWNAGRSWFVVCLFCTLCISTSPFERPLVADDVRILKGHQLLVSHLAFSPDSRLPASSACDKTVKLWSVATGEVLRTLEGHQDCVWGVAFAIWPHFSCANYFPVVTASPTQPPTSHIASKTS